jgi:hypothetical protein
MLFKASIIDKFANHTLNEAYICINDAIEGVQRCYLESYKQGSKETVTSIYDKCIAKYE